MLASLFVIGRRHLTERPARTAITLCGIALGVSVSVAIRTANVEVLRSFEESVTTVAGRATLELSGGELGLDERVITEVRRHPGVRSAEPVIHQATQVAAGAQRGRALVVMAFDLLSVAEMKAFRLRATKGTEPDLNALLEPDTLFVGARLASDWGLQVGARLELLAGTRKVSVVVRGIIESERGLASVWDHLAVMDVAAAQFVFGLTGRLDRIDIETEPDQPIAQVQAELARVLPPPLTVRRPSHRNEQVERMLRAFQLNLMTLSAVGLLIGLLLVYNTISFAVVQRRREIGIVRAVGMTRGGVCVLFLGEAALLGLGGGVLGSVIGAALARTLVAMVSRTVSDLYVPVPSLLADAPAFLGVPLSMVIESGLVGVAVSMLGALAPSLDAGRTAAARALAPGEYETTQTLRTGRLACTGIGALALAAALALPGPVNGAPLFGYVSALCLLIGLSCVAPAVVRGIGDAARWAGWTRLGGLGGLAADQVGRAPGRNAVTVSALMIGVTIMVGVGVMIQSFRQTVEIWINQTVLADLVVAPDSWLQGEETGMLSKRIPFAWSGTVAALPGVAAVDTYRDLTVDLQGRRVALVSRDLRIHAERSRYLFVNGRSSEILLGTIEEQGVVISEVLANTFGIQAGDTIRLLTPAGERGFPVVGVFYDYATDGGKLVMDRALYRQVWQDDTTTVIAVYLDPGADPETVRRRIEEALRAEGHHVIISNAELKREILAIFDRTFTVTYALELIAVVIALLGIINTLLTAVLERQRELATLRAVGASRGQIKWLVLWEASYLGLVGAALGLLGGLLLALLLVEVINKQSFGWSIQLMIPAGLLAKALVLTIGAALLAGYVPARWAARQPIADGLRYE
jgi:putative ABC transport system permease protein